MIVDKLSNSTLYYGLSEEINRAFSYLHNTNFNDVPPGKYEIDGDKVFAIVAEYQTEDESEGKPESHKKYIDVQYVVKGSELIGYAPLVNQVISEPYNEENDIIFYKTKCSFLELSKGMFAIFYPDDIHLPGIKVGEKILVKKVVVKVRVYYVETY
ncbi:MAG TPA: YhcH/YjgK/YiaL family protein [Ignavibacteriaceae bacterium]|nr:YhcH/YjgK/YiaL family protein [Ignavibacteriaceae bacterium]